MPDNIRHSRKWPKCITNMYHPYDPRCKNKCDPKTPEFTAHQMCIVCVRRMESQYPPYKRGQKC